MREWRSSLVGSSGEADDTHTLEGELEGIQINLERVIRKSAEQLATFEVHPKYREYEQEASELTTRIHDLVNENVVARETLELQTGIAEGREAEEIRDTVLLLCMRKRASLSTDQVTERLQEVQAFHERVYTNRREHLRGEMDRLEASIDAREREKGVLSSKRAETLDFLSRHGALEEYARLQEMHNEVAERLASVKAQLEQLRGFEEELSKLRVESEELVLDARADFEARREIWSVQGGGPFGSNTAALYEEPGTLAVNVSSTGGLGLGIEIERGDSQGVQEMVVLCYDLMLAQRWATNFGPSFSIHDSTIFDEWMNARSHALSNSRRANPATRLSIHLLPYSRCGAVGRIL